MSEEFPVHLFLRSTFLIKLWLCFLPSHNISAHFLLLEDFWLVFLLCSVPPGLVGVDIIPWLESLGTQTEKSPHKIYGSQACPQHISQRLPSTKQNDFTLYSWGFKRFLPSINPVKNTESRCTGGKPERYEGGRTYWLNHKPDSPGVRRPPSRLPGTQTLDILGFWGSMGNVSIAFFQKTTNKRLPFGVLMTLSKPPKSYYPL